MASLNSILGDCKIIRVMNAQAAGATPVNSSLVDTQGYDGVCFVGAIGALTATQVTNMKAQHGDAAGGGDQADITSGATAAMADGDSNKLLVVDVRRPSKRYVRVVVGRATANAVIDGVNAILYRSAKVPITQDTAQVSKSVLVTAS